MSGEGEGEGFLIAAAQRRAWPDAARTRVQAIVRIDGAIAAETLRARLHALVARHAALRTTFVQVDGLKFPLQLVHETLAPVFGESAGDVHTVAVAERRAPLTDSPLRACLVRDQLVLTLSPLAGDPGTLQQCVRELADAEAAPATELEYLQLAAWQESLLESSDAEAGRELWRARAAAAGTPARLLFENDADSNERAWARRTIGRDATLRLDHRAAELGVSREALVLAAWHTALYRVTGADALATWVTLDGREAGALAALCGTLATAVPIVAADTPAATDEALRTAAEWLPYYRPDLDAASACPELRLGFEYVERIDPIHAGGLTWTLAELDPATPPGELRLVCLAGGGRLELQVAHDPARHATPYVQALVDEVAAILDERAEAAPATAATAAATGVVHTLFEAQAARTPDRLAVRCAAHAFTFDELNRRANRLAHALLGRGVRREEPVAILLDRSSHMLVAILAVLKAGGAYVPLHTGYPAERLRYILDETGARVVLTQPTFAAALAGRQVIHVDEALAGTGGADTANPAHACTPEQLAYVIYTSGSTGTPKGVEITHASVVNLLHALRHAIYDGLGGAPLGVSLNAPIVFDASVKQWIQLLDGHALHVIPEDTRIDPGALAAYVAAHGIDVLDVTPSLLRPLLAGAPDFAPRAVLVGGEAVDAPLWQAMRARAATRFFDVYGPTECTVDATVAAVAGERPTIGAPVLGASAHVLDAAGRPLPIGAPGELYVGGAGVARGYCRRPELTAERFVPDPTTPGARLYRTGDVVWRRADGALEYLGRRDGQVKLRGHRIELDEIATLLCRAPDVRDAAAFVRGTGDDARLVAYVIPAAGVTPSRERLRAGLREQLPDYMIPSAFVWLSTWPLTANGKLDSAALPAPDAAATGASGAPAHLGSATERTIAAIWQDVLGLDKVGPHDNFFDLGGHSLRMVKVHARLREAFQRDIQMVELFRRPTIAALSQYFDQENPVAAPGRASASSERARRRISAATSGSNRKGKRRP